MTDQRLIHTITEALNDVRIGHTNHAEVAGSQVLIARIVAQHLESKVIWRDDVEAAILATATYYNELPDGDEVDVRVGLAHVLQKLRAGSGEQP